MSDGKRWEARPATATCSDIMFDGKECYGSMLHLNAAETVRRLNQRDRFLAAAAAAQNALAEVEALSDNCVNAERYGAEDALEDLQAIRRVIARYKAASIPAPPVEVKSEVVG